MLRNIVLALGATMIVAGAGGLFTHYFAFAIILIVWGAMIAFAIVYERFSSAYRKVSAKAPTGKNWVQTNEKLIDKKSGTAVVVYYQTWTGERLYVPLHTPLAEEKA
ncbi:MAG: hypothetical protein WCD42_14655 [Rhizomicrobium sp.]